MKFFDNYVKNFDESMMLGIKTMYGGSVTRSEFDDMLRERRAKRGE
ncbi:MAG: hypothetical protein Q4D42_03915 [Eubacteriales bacterium]|nr:hypothetical protein [Eubacteriales bacterium]